MAKKTPKDAIKDAPDIEPSVWRRLWAQNPTAYWEALKDFIGYDPKYDRQEHPNDGDKLREASRGIWK